MPGLPQSGTPVEAGQIEVLENIANSRASLTGKPYNFTAGNWLAELNRLRSRLLLPQINPYVSGPWPVAGPQDYFGGRFGGAVDYITGNEGGREVWFYFAGSQATANNTSVNLHWRGPVSSNDPNVPFVSIPTNVKHLECSIIIGGNVPVRFRGRLGFWLNNGFQPISMTCTVATTFPGATFSMGPAPPPGIEIQHCLTDYIDTIVTPGEYTFTADITSDGVFHYPTLLGEDAPPNGTYCDLTADVGTIEEWPGIHTSLDTWRIHASVPNSDSGFPFGIWMWGTYGWTGNLPEFQATLKGLWAARTTSIGGLRDLTAYMPWNPLLTGGANGSNNGRPSGATPHERRTQPQEGQLVVRSSTTPVTAGNYVKAAGFYHAAVQTGVTGDTEPAWNTTVGGSVVDGTVTWRNFGTNLPTRARMFSLPRYPVWKDGDQPTMQPASRYDYWTNFITHNSAENPTQTQPYWFIYRIRLNRIVPESATSPDQLKIDGDDATFPPIAVELGCLRNGVFHSFGTWPTGAWVEVETGMLDEDGEPILTDHVLWPIFTQHAIMYRCSERVDVQAELVTTPPTFSHNVSFPILASHYTDTLALLNQII